MRLSIVAVLLLVGALSRALPLGAYPLDGYEITKIPRLEGYFYSLRVDSLRENFVPGALLSRSEIKLLPVGERRELPPLSQDLSRRLDMLLRPHSEVISIGLLDISQPEAPVFGGLNLDRIHIPGSVGKIVVAVGVFAALAELFPADYEARRALLRERVIRANDFVLGDHHDVPFWDRESGQLSFRPLEPGDEGNLWTYLDWMLSASSNAAGSMLMREVVLMRRFGAAYPPTPLAEQEFWAGVSSAELNRLVLQGMARPIAALGLSPEKLRQTSFFTRPARQVFASQGSSMTMRGLVEFMYLLEQGLVVDRFSSLELKRLFYATQKRIRYAESPALDAAALYYKSGSLYSCRPEPGFDCGRFRGNVRNIMNFVGIVEEPAGAPRYRYIVALGTNVLRKHSSDYHAEIGGLIATLVGSGLTRE